MEFKTTVRCEHDSLKSHQWGTVVSQLHEVSYLVTLQSDRQFILAFGIADEEARTSGSQGSVHGVVQRMCELPMAGRWFETSPRSSQHPARDGLRVQPNTLQRRFPNHTSLKVNVNLVRILMPFISIISISVLKILSVKTYHNFLVSNSPRVIKNILLS